jgi:hypothetical protein
MNNNNSLMKIYIEKMLEPKRVAAKGLAPCPCADVCDVFWSGLAAAADETGP